MLLSVTEQLQVFWDNIKTWLPTIISVATALVVAFLQGIIKKSITKENFTEVAHEMLDNTYSQIGKVTLDMNVEPIVDERVKKYFKTLTQEQTEAQKELEKKIDTQNQLLVYLLKNFENNISIDSDTKQEIKDYISGIAEEKVSEEELTKPVEVKVAISSTKKESTEEVAVIDR